MKNIWKILVLAVCVGILSLILSFSTIFDALNQHLENSLYTRYKPENDKIVIVEIDDKSTILSPNGLNMLSKWSRNNFTKILEETEFAKLVAFDILFDTYTTAIEVSVIKDLQESIKSAEESEKESLLLEFFKNYANEKTNLNDILFANKLNEKGNVILASSMDLEKNQFLKPLDIFKQRALDTGYIAKESDKNNLVKTLIPQTPPDNKSFPLVIAERFANREFKIPTNKHKQMLINYFEPFPKFSFIDVYNGNIDKNEFKDKIVLLGVTSKVEVKDEFLTPISSKELMSGVEINANAIQTILDEKFILNQSDFSRTLTILLLSLALTFALAFTNIPIASLIATLTLVGYYLAARLFFHTGIILNLIYPFIAIFLSYIAVFAYRYFVADKSKREIKSAFSRYVSKDLVEQISQNPEQVKLGGEKREITVFFSDIKGSTTISEQVPIEQWVSQINEYFTVMENLIQRQGGTLDKYEGDAIMGFWGAPVAQSDHTERAYASALDMKKALFSLHERWKTQGRPLLEFRIGINTGTAIVGNFGSQNRFDYTAMGDTVNTASRLESSANKSYGTSIIVANSDTKTLSRFVFRELDTVFLPGKNEPIILFELCAEAKDLRADKKAILDNYAQGLSFYRAKDFERSLAHFEKNTDDPPSKIMLARCKALKDRQTIPEIDENMVFKILNK